MNRDTESNEFLRHIYDLYDCIKFPEKANIVVTEKRGKGIKGFFKKEIIKRDIRKEEVEEKIRIFINSLVSSVPDFDRLWDFCEFVRVSEKVFFYPNRPERKLYVECDLKKAGSGERKFRIKSGYSEFGNEVEIRFTLEKNVLSNNIISIQVIRNFGLNMKTEYKVVDGDLPFNDSSDLYLINQINFILRDSIISTFNEVINGYINCK